MVGTTIAGYGTDAAEPTTTWFDADGNSTVTADGLGDTTYTTYDGTTGRWR